MRYDLDLARAILEYIEDNLPARKATSNVPIQGYDTNTLNAHIKLLCDSGYIDGRLIVGLMEEAPHIDGLRGFRAADL